MHLQVCLKQASATWSTCGLCCKFIVNRRRILLLVTFTADVVIVPEITLLEFYAKITQNYAGALCIFNLRSDYCLASGQTIWTHFQCALVYGLFDDYAADQHWHTIAEPELIYTRCLTLRTMKSCWSMTGIWITNLCYQSGFLAHELEALLHEISFFEMWRICVQAAFVYSTWRIQLTQTSHSRWAACLGLCYLYESMVRLRGAEKFTSQTSVMLRKHWLHSIHRTQRLLQSMRWLPLYGINVILRLFKACPSMIYMSDDCTARSWISGLYITIGPNICPRQCRPVQAAHWLSHYDAHWCFFPFLLALSPVTSRLSHTSVPQSQGLVLTLLGMPREFGNWSSHVPKQSWPSIDCCPWIAGQRVCSIRSDCGLARQRAGDNVEAASDATAGSICFPQLGGTKHA